MGTDRSTWPDFKPGSDQMSYPREKHGVRQKNYRAEGKTGLLADDHPQTLERMRGDEMKFN